jgi:hypothetical protein
MENVRMATIMDIGTELRRIKQIAQEAEGLAATQHVDPIVQDELENIVACACRALDRLAKRRMP